VGRRHGPAVGRGTLVHMQTEIEGHRARPPILRRAVAGLVLIVAAVLAVHFIVGLIMTVFWVIVAAAVVIAVLWAIKTLAW
jgi:hypothetical protein